MFQYAVSGSAKPFSRNSSGNINFFRSAKFRWLVKFGVLFCLFLASPPLRAQMAAQQWFFLVRDSDGRFFVQKKIDALENGNRGMWTKIVYSDWSWKTGYDEWDCKKRRFRTTQVSSYTADGELIRTARNLEWVLITPEAVSEALFAEACGEPAKVKYAVITSAQADLRDSAEAGAKVVRTVKKKEKFPLASTKPVGTWYVIYDPQTLVEYWLRDNTFKIE